MTITKKTSFELFTGLWNATQGQATPAVHRRIAAWLARASRRKIRRLLLMAFRGCGKSTMVGLFCAWLLCHDPELRILIVAADEGLAENMLRHIRQIIETHPMARFLLPKRKQLWSSDRLIIGRLGKGRDPSIRAAGVHSNLTGSRADIIIADDVEVPNTSDSLLKREKLRQALRELDFILTPGGLVLYIGTPHAEQSIYKQGDFLDGYQRLEIPLAPHVWPARFDCDTIDAIRQAVGPRVFASQMLLQPIALREARLDTTQIAVYDHDVSAMARYCHWDPAFGHANGDRSVIALVLFDADNRAWVHDMLCLRVTADANQDEASQQCAQVVDFLRRHDIAGLTLENNGIGQFLPGLLRQKIKHAQLRCAVQAIHHSKSKSQRIVEAFDALLAARSLSVHARVVAQGFLNEMAAWQPQAGHERDDMLDAVAAAIARHVPRYAAHRTYHVRKESEEI